MSGCVFFLSQAGYVTKREARCFAAWYVHPLIHENDMLGGGSNEFPGFQGGSDAMIGSFNTRSKLHDFAHELTNERRKLAPSYPSKRIAMLRKNPSQGGTCPNPSGQQRLR